MNHLCKQIVAAARYLQSTGMSTEQLRSVHHSNAGRETFASTFRYFGVKKELRPINIAYANRLIHIASEHRRGSGTLAQPIEQSLVQWPLYGCGLTLRSSRPAPARSTGRRGPSTMLLPSASGPCLRGRLSSNVRPRKPPPRQGRTV